MDQIKYCTSKGEFLLKDITREEKESFKEDLKNNNFFMFPNWVYHSFSRPKFMIHKFDDGHNAMCCLDENQWHIIGYDPRFGGPNGYIYADKVALCNVNNVTQISSISKWKIVEIKENPEVTPSE